MCSQCSEIGTLDHHFFSCARFKHFWGQFFICIKRLFSVRWQADLYSFIGMLYVPNVVNLLIIIGKHHIHSCTVHYKPLQFNSYVPYIDDMRKI